MDDLSYRIFSMSSAGYCCSQIMVKLALDAEEKENPDLLRALKGLCKGIAGHQGPCGVLTGGIAILGLYAGNGEDGERAKEDYNTMVKEYYEWFEEEHGAIDCRDLIGINSFDGTDVSYKGKCGQFMAAGFAKVCDILSEHGYDFGSRE